MNIQIEHPDNKDADNTQRWVGCHQGAVLYVSPRQRNLTPVEARVRDVAYALKTAETWAVAEAALWMAPWIPHGSTLVPIPSSKGCTRVNYVLAQELLRRCCKLVIRDVLSRVQPVQSSRKLRASGVRGLAPTDHGMIYTPGEELLEPVIFVDNVLTTGSTFEAARRALEKAGIDARGVAYARAQEVLSR